MRSPSGGNKRPFDGLKQLKEFVGKIFTPEFLILSTLFSGWGGKERGWPGTRGALWSKRLPGKMRRVPFYKGVFFTGVHFFIDGALSIWRCPFLKYAENSFHRQLSTSSCLRGPEFLSTADEAVRDIPRCYQTETTM